MKTTKERTPTTRGTIWIGQTCNLRCKFCYYKDVIANPSHPQHAFIPLPKILKIVDTLKNHYGNTHVDIEGGEPTIYKDIYGLVEHCAKIDLKPTLITNAQILHNPGILQRYKDCGLNDLLVSYHGIGDVHDEAVGVAGAYANLSKSVDAIINENIQFRINCTVSKIILPTIMEVAKVAVGSGVKIVNFIAFNPFTDQKSRSKDIVATYSEIAKALEPVIVYLEENNIEVNLRYFPFCVFNTEFRKNIYNFPQLPYDHHEWDYASWIWTEEYNQRTATDDLDPVTFSPVDPVQKEAFLLRDAQKRAISCAYESATVCQVCNMKRFCDKAHEHYIDFFGESEFNPIKEVISSSIHYCKEQEKYVV